MLNGNSWKLSCKSAVIELIINISLSLYTVTEWRVYVQKYPVEKSYLVMLTTANRADYIAAFGGNNWNNRDKGTYISLSLSLYIYVCCFMIISHQAPIYLLELLHLYTPSWQLCYSADTQVFRIPSSKKSPVVSAVSLTGLWAIWNQLPISIRHSTSVSA